MKYTVEEMILEYIDALTENRIKTITLHWKRSNKHKEVSYNGELNIYIIDSSNIYNKTSLSKYLVREFNRGIYIGCTV